MPSPFTEDFRYQRDAPSCHLIYLPPTSHTTSTFTHTLRLTTTRPSALDKRWQDSARHHTPDARPPLFSSAHLRTLSRNKSAAMSPPHAESVVASFDDFTRCCRLPDVHACRPPSPALLVRRLTGHPVVDRFLSRPATARPLATPFPTRHRRPPACGVG